MFHKEGVDKHSSTVEMQIAWTMLSSCNSGKSQPWGCKKLRVQLIHKSLDLRRSGRKHGVLDVMTCVSPSISRMRRKIIHQTQYSSGHTGWSPCT
ncbi:hypothetical protein ACROYT_G028744 [Oculina patagonica]